MKMPTTKSTLPEELWDFRAFLYLTWICLGLPKPTKRQYEIAWALQHGTDRQIIAALRGEGKSWIASAYAMWCLAMYPDLKVLVLSASKQRADDFVLFCKRLMEFDHLAHLEPSKEQRTSTVGFDVRGASAAHAPSLRSQGIEGQITGGRADLIIPDDIEVPSNSWTAGGREKLLKLSGEFGSIIMPPHDGIVPKTVLLGTPHTQESLYLELAERGYEMTMWPARFPDDVSAYSGRLAPMIARELLEDPSLVGKPTDPERFTHEDLMQREAEMGRSQFLMQFQLNTELADEDRYPLKLRDAVCMDLDDTVGPERVLFSSNPEDEDRELPNMGFRSDRWQRPKDIFGKLAEYDSVVMFVDPAGRGADECAYVIVGMLNSTLYVLDWGGFLDGYSVPTLTTMAKLGARYKVSRVVAEANYGDGMWGTLLRPYLQKFHPCTFEEIKVSGNKEARMLDILEPLWQQHRIVFNRSRVISEIRELKARDNPAAERDYNLFYQATHLCREIGALRHDDRIDCLSMAASWFSEMLGRSQAEAYADKQHETYLESIESFIQATGGHSRRKSLLGSYRAI